MFPSLQPSRPKVPHQPTEPKYAYQQRRTAHELPQSQAQPQQQASRSLPNPQKPQSQIEAMPPNRTAPPVPAQSFYDAAKRHPVFFTSNLRKPPFPIPQMPSQGWSPVANGYIQERQKGQGGMGTKL